MCVYGATYLAISSPCPFPTINQKWGGGAGVEKIDSSIFVGKRLTPNLACASDQIDWYLCVFVLLGLQGMNTKCRSLAGHPST